jgi:hypothetical protein
MGTASGPDRRFIAFGLDMAPGMNGKQLRMQRALKERKI